MSNIISKSISVIKHWWLLLLSGILLIVVSIYVLMTPEESYVTLAWVFSILVFVNGISYVIFSISNRKELEGWGWYLVGGIFEIVIGFILISYPALTLLLLPLMVGFWLIFRGAQIVGFSLDMKEYGFLDWGWFMLFGVLIIIMAFFMILDPLFGFSNVVYLTSISLFIFGVANIMISLKLKKIKAATIDKVQAVKNAFKQDLKNLKKEVSKTIKAMSPEEQAELNKTFEDFEANME